MNWKLISWNVNGIRAIEKKGFLEWLVSSEADLVAVQETKAHPEQLSAALLNPPGYQVQWNWAEKKGYSGTGTYSRHAALKVISGLGNPRFDTEGRTLIHEFDPFVFFNIYFPNGGRGPEWVAHKLAFYKRCIEVIQDYMQAGRGVVVTGDFNTAFAESTWPDPKKTLTTAVSCRKNGPGWESFLNPGWLIPSGICIRNGQVFLVGTW